MSKPPELSITTLTVGPLASNCVIVTAAGQDKALLFDPGADSPDIFQALDKLGVTPEQIVLTHCHGDHIGAVADVKEKYPDAPLVVPEPEKEWLSSSVLNLSLFSGMPITAPDADELFNEGHVVEVGAIKMTAIHVPGHSPGGMAFYAAPEDGGPVLVAGDILFAGSVGRVDFPHSDGATL